MQTIKTSHHELPGHQRPPLRHQRIIRVTVPKPEVDRDQIERVTQRPADSMSHTTLRVVGLLIKGDQLRLRRAPCSARAGALAITQLRPR